MNNVLLGQSIGDAVRIFKLLLRRGLANHYGVKMQNHNHDASETPHRQIRAVYDAELGAPFVKRRTADAMLSAQLRHRCTNLRLLQHRHDLAVSKSGLLHAKSPQTRCEKFYI